MRLGILVGMLSVPSILLAQDLDAGADLYARHCATCHGVDATGNGPMAPSLLVQPVDLTKLSEGNGGKFPRVRVIARIDGRDPLVSHGSDMPIYGWYFEGEAFVLRTDAGQPIMTTRPIAELVGWLETIQDNAS